MKKLFYVTLFALIGSTLCVTAQRPIPDNHRYQFEQPRHHEEFAQGQLTPKEVRKIEKLQRKLDLYKLKAQSDGVVTKSEFHHIMKEQNRIDEIIYKAKHDAQIRSIR
jgi:hypothetical protein